MQIFKNLDFLLVFPLIIIFCLGALTLFSIDVLYFKNQLLFFGLGILIFFLLSNLDYKIFKSFYTYLYLLSIFLLLLTFILGQITRGATRWIKIGGFGLQSSELVKPLLVLSFSSIALRQNLKKIKNIFIFSMIFFFPALLIFKQPDLGNTLALLALWLGVLLFKGIEKKHILIGIVISLSVIPLGWQVLKPYQKARIISFADPEYDALGTGYNLIQSKIAIGSGLFSGKGLGEGTQSQLRFLPERQSDFIFACLAEELGFIGASFLILAVAALILRILVISKKSGDLFGSLICGGTALLLFFQAFINIGMNLGVVPITGLTLPMVSYGGSSLISTMALLGIVQSVAIRGQKERAIEIN